MSFFLTRFFRHILFALPVLLALPLSARAADPVSVASVQELHLALTAARQPKQPPLTLQLASGTYGRVVIKGIQSPVRLVPEDPRARPRLSGLNLQDSRGVTFEGLVFDYAVKAEAEPVRTAPFRVAKSRDISFRNVLFDGDLARGLGPAENGFPAGKALLVQDSQDLAVTDSEIRSFFAGLSFLRSRNITIARNNIHSLRNDGVNAAQVSDLVFENNKVHSFVRAPDAGDHPDMFQMWTHRTDAPSKRVTIRNNVFNSGHGLWTQTIFMRNDRVDKGDAGEELFYRNIRIENNVIINAHRHGIFVGEADGVVIRNNTVIRNLRSGEAHFSENLASPRILVADRSRNVVVERNAAYAFPKTRGGSWRIQDNIAIQANGRLAPGFYGRVFKNALTGDPLDLENFRYLTDGPLSGRSIGASLLKVQQ